METHCGHYMEAHGRHQSCPYVTYTWQDPALPLQFLSKEIKDDKVEMLRDRGTSQGQREFYLHLTVLQNIRQEGCGCQGVNDQGNLCLDERRHHVII